MLSMENYQGNTNYNLLEDSDIVNNLTSGGTNKALSAEQGKFLNENFVAVSQAHTIKTKGLTFTFYKIGKIVNFSVSGTINLSSHGQDMFDLPEGLVPIQNVSSWFGAIASDNSLGTGRIAVETRGKVYMFSSYVGTQECTVSGVYFLK